MPKTSPFLNYQSFDVNYIGKKNKEKLIRSMENNYQNISYHWSKLWDSGQLTNIKSFLFLPFCQSISLWYPLPGSNKKHKKHKNNYFSTPAKDKKYEWLEHSSKQEGLYRKK